MPARLSSPAVRIVPDGAKADSGRHLLEIFIAPHPAETLILMLKICEAKRRKKVITRQQAGIKAGAESGTTVIVANKKTSVAGCFF